MPACASTLDRTPPAYRPLIHSTATQFTEYPTPTQDRPAPISGQPDRHDRFRVPPSISDDLTATHDDHRGPGRPGNGPSRRRTVGHSFRSSEPSTPRDLAQPNVAILEQLVARVVAAGTSRGATGSRSLPRPRCGSVRCQASGLVTSIWSEADSRPSADVPRSRRSGNEGDQGAPAEDSPDHRPAASDTHPTDHRPSRGGTTSAQARGA
jgi:hypothetical protein